MGITRFTVAVITGAILGVVLALLAASCATTPPPPPSCLEFEPARQAELRAQGENLMGIQEFTGGLVIMYGNGTVVTRADFVTRADVPEPPADLNITKVGECMSEKDGLLKIYTQTQEPGKLSLNDAVKTSWYVTLTKAVK